MKRKTYVLSISLLILILITVSVGFTQAANQRDKVRMKIYSSKDGKEISFENLTDSLSEYDVIFVGEKHDDGPTHVIEARLLKSLYEKKPSLSVGMEMFERDVQNTLNQYLKGKIDEKEFLEKSRPWPNYEKDYREIIEFSKSKGIPVVAGNVPRRYAAMIVRKGVDSIKEVPDNEKAWLPRELKVLDDDYKKRFLKTMEGMNHGPMAGKNNEGMYAAQCLKDDTMAESIAAFFDKSPDKKPLIHYNGSFHSDYHLGTAKKLALLKPDLKIAVISCIPADDPEKGNFKEERDRGDFIIFTASSSPGVESNLNDNKSSSENPDIIKQIKAGREKINRGDYEKALIIFNEVLKKDPKNGRAILNKGEVLEKLGRSEEAADFLTKMVKIDYNKVDEVLGIIHVLTRIKKYDEAFDLIDKYTGKKGPSTEINLARAVILSRQGKRDEALKIVDGIIKKDRKNAGALVLKGQILTGKNRPNEALEYYSKALKVDPKSVEGWLGRGAIMLAEGKYKDSLKYYDKAAKIKPSEGLAWFGKGLAQMQLNRKKEALESFDRAVLFNPAKAEAWGYRGTILLLMKKDKEAMKSFEKAAELGMPEAKIFLQMLKKK